MASMAAEKIGCCVLAMPEFNRSENTASYELIEQA